MIYKLLFLTQCLLCVCLCELSIEGKEKLLNDFVVYYNNLPNQLYTCDEGVMKNAQQTAENTFKIEVNLKVSRLNNVDVTKFLMCTATVQNSQDNIRVINDDMKCEEQHQNVATIEQPTGQAAVTEPAFENKPIQLDNEIQANTAATSGEQFIAIPRERPSTPCVGCSTHVNPQAAGVSDLASLGVKHLDKHEPSVRHSVDTILDVERQVQVVNGVRYILTLLVNFNSCTETETEACTSTRACKISVLVKPWVKLPNGSKYRAILANNCTEEWQYGDNGEVLPEDSDDNRANNQIDGHPSKDGGPNDDIKAVHNPDVESLPNQERKLTEEQVRDIEEQIIPKNQFQQVSPKTENHEVFTTLPDSDVSKQHAVKDESRKHNSDNSIPSVESTKLNTKSEHSTQDKSNLSKDKKQAIDDMLNFFDFSGFKPNLEVDQVKPRMKRSYDYDLQVLSLAENYQDIKKRLENAKFVYTLAQEMIDYLNEMDMTVKNRVLKNVLNAEEEFENYQHFVYIQALVTIPCDKADCEPEDTVAKICNGVIDSTNKDKPQILNTFCHKDHKEKSEKGIEVPLNDPVLQNLVKTAIKKIESESSSKHAIRLNKIVSANTRQVSGTLTKISVMIDYINCNKSVPYTLKQNCTVLEQLGSRICEVIAHERHWLKEKKISYSCTEVPIDVIMSKEKVINENKTVDDPKIWEMLREALQQLEVQSNRNNKQKIVKINSVSSQIIAGFVTKIEFLVGYTTCNNEYVLNQPSRVCELLPNERFRKCLAQFWDRSWIEDGRQMEVACDDDLKKVDNDFKKNNNDIAIDKSRSKRSLTVVGEPTEYNVNDPQYEYLALESSSVTHGHSRLKRDRSVGGLTEQDPTNPKYIKLAEESLNKYKATIGGNDLQYLQVVAVDKVTTQVVAGSLIRLNFTVSTGHCDDIKCFSKIWERLWLNSTDIDVTCDIESRKHSITKRSLGGSKERDPTDPKYTVLAEHSLQKYTQNTGTTQSLKLIHVEKVTTQVVSGVITEIDFVLAESENSEHIKCHSKIWEQPWLNKEDINVTCQANNVRVKRQLPGGLTEQNASDPNYLTLAKESLQKYLGDAGVTNSHKVVQVNKVFTQVVAGTKTLIDFDISQLNKDDIITCHSEIWKRPWLGTKEITVTCNIKAQTNQERHNRAKRGLSGGKTEQKANDTKYFNLAEEALDKYVSDTGNTNPLKVLKVTKVYTQVVSGLKTFINFEVSQLNSDKVISCETDIWEQKWLNKKEINVQCNENEENSREKRYILHGKRMKNGKKVQDPKGKQYHSLAEESLREYERLKGNGVNHKVIEVKHVVTQVVSGMIYFIDYTATPTTCSVDDCNNDNHIMHCHTKIWSRSWLQLKEIDVSCYSNDESLIDNDTEYNDDTPEITPNKNSRPTGLLGAPEAKNVNTPKYKKLAKETLDAYLTKSNIKYLHKVTKIHSVTEQVVEGIITKIQYSIAPTTCLREEVESEYKCGIKQPQVDLLCTAEVWERPWLSDKNIKVHCGKNFKGNTNFRGKRQTPNDVDYIDDELKYYYANRAVQNVNEQTRGGHLHKLITIHALQRSTQMKTSMVRMYIELAETFCLRHQDELELQNCEEMDGLNHKLCLARLWPSPDDELVVRHTSVICDDEDDFESISGLHVSDLLVMSINEYEKNPDVKFKTVHQGEPHIVPSLDSKVPIVINFLLATTNCTKNVNLTNSLFECYIDMSLPTKSCTSYFWLMPNGKSIKTMTVSCSSPLSRTKRSSDRSNTTTDDIEIQKLVTAALEKLEMESLQRYKQRVLQINSHSTKITSGKVTTIDFDVGYTACLKYEWVANVTSCDFVEHLPRRHCVAQIWERLWLNNGKNIDVRCEDDETPLEAHIEFESAEMAMELARAALKHIEAKYPHPRKQKVVRIFSLEKQVVAGIHYRMKIEVGLTDCMALSERSDCKFAEGLGINKFCRVNVWIRPWTDHPPNYRVSCDYQDGSTTELYRNIQAEHLFYDFITTNNPTYINDHNELRRRFDIFKANVRRIHELNVYEMGTARYGITRFADLTYEEFRTKYTGLKPSLRNHNHVPMSKARIPYSRIPESFDWRDYDAVTEVKDQGSCGSCWAFSVTGNIEGQWKMQSGQLLSLSEQELVDCDKMDEGCNGGLMDNAYRAIEELGGLETETDYPYEGEDDKCAYNKTISKVQISGAVNISSNETEMAMWLLHNGPISIGINANAMQFYMGGISHPWKMLCNPTNLDHGVLVVGYGTKDYPLFHKHLPYWTVKNSWGKSWGEQGYYRVYRGDGTCGVNQMASSAVV